MRTRLSRIFGTIAFLAVICLALAAPAGAVSWVLALPPVKANPQASTDDPRATVRDHLDQKAPVHEWRQGEVFDSGEACENARLSAIKAFDDAAESADGAQPSGEQLQRLNDLGLRAFGRCVPALAFSASR